MRNKGNADYTNRPLNNAERESVRLDYEYEDHKQERHNRIEPW